MEYLLKDASWFFSQEGVAAYGQQQSVEDKTLFLYAYLVKALDESYDKDNTLFRFSLFLADAVAGGGFAYSEYPKLIDSTANPFLTYLTNWKKNPGKKVLHYGFLSILHQIADPGLSNNWIYDKALMESDSLEEKLIELEHNFYADKELGLPNPRAFDIAEEHKPVQLKLMWLFASK